MTFLDSHLCVRFSVCGYVCKDLVLPTHYSLFNFKPRSVSLPALMSKHTSLSEEAFSKVPEVTLLFWIIKIAATTLGEIGGDAVTMSMNLGYLVGTAIFAVIFARK